RIDVVFTGAVEASAGAERALVRAGQIAHLPAGWSEARYREQTREAYALFGPDIRLAAEWGPNDPPPAPERMRLWPEGVANGSISGTLCHIEHSAAATLDVLTARLLAGDQIPLQGT